MRESINGHQVTNQSSAGNIFLGVLAIATIRDFLEVALEGRMLINIEHPLNSLKTYFLHFNSFYFLVFVSLSLVLYLFALKRMRTEESLTFTFDTNILANANLGGGKQGK